MSDQPIIIKKKKVHGGHGHHGGSWKVAYADFVTAMMAFFMVMWIMGLSDESKAQIQGYFNDPLGFNKSMPRSRQVISIKGVPATKSGSGREPEHRRFGQEQNNLRKVVNELRGAIEKDPKLKGLLSQVEISLTRDGLRIEFIESPHVAFFQSGSSVLLPEAREMVAKLAPVIAKTGNEMIIEGHTDAKPYAGENFTNWDLSTERALSMRRALTQFGVKVDQFRAIRGLADTELRKPNDPFSASNRRVSILLPWKSLEESEKDKQKDTRPPHIGPLEPKIAPDYEPPMSDSLARADHGAEKAAASHSGGGSHH